MKSRDHETLIREIDEQFIKGLSPEATPTIKTIRNLIESNSRVEESIDELHKSISSANE